MNPILICEFCGIDNQNITIYRKGTFVFCEKCSHNTLECSYCGKNGVKYLKGSISLTKHYCIDCGNKIRNEGLTQNKVQEYQNKLTKDYNTLNDATGVKRDPLMIIFNEKTFHMF